MASTVQQAAPPALQPTIAALKGFQSAIAAWGAQNGLNVDSGTTNPLYIPYTQIVNLVTLLLDTLETPQTANQVQQLGGTLYDLGAMFYDDLTQGFAIMYANGMWTPWLSTSLETTVNLPPAQTLSPPYGVSAGQVAPTS